MNSVPERGQTTPSLSVIVCTYNRLHVLKDCLDSLREQLDEACAELVVINDGASDGTADFLANEKATMTVGGWNANRGLNAARNEGLRLARAPIVLYFDDDQRPPPGYLLRIQEALKADFDGVGGPLRDQGGGLRTCEQCSIGESTLGSTARQVEVLIGGNMALRKSAFDRCGLFDEDLSGRGDETEWFSRSSDLRFYYDPDLWVWHSRDDFSLWDLATHGYRQGKAIPQFDSKTGAAPQRHLRQAVRFAAHAARRRCANGVVKLSRECGAAAAQVRGQRG